MLRAFGTTVTVLLLSSALFSKDCDTLKFDSDGFTLTGYFYASSFAQPYTLIFTQGFMETGDIWDLGKALSNRGINVFMFDFRGCFLSEGKQGLMNSQEDIEAALQFLSSKEMVSKYSIDTSKFILGGYSYGGHMSMLYAVHHPGIKRIISVSGGDLGILAHLFRNNPDIRRKYSNIFRSIRKPNGPVQFQYEDPVEELLQKQEYFSISAQSEKLTDTDILMTGGLDDKFVSMEDYLLPLYRKLKENNRLKIRFLVYQTDHSYDNVSDKLVNAIYDWITRQ